MATQEELAGYHVLVMAPTGLGKSYAIWMPLLFEDITLIVITPLNSLAEQHSIKLQMFRSVSIAIRGIYSAKVSDNA